MLEICKRQVNLETLNLSENLNVSDKVTEDLSYLFTSSSTIKHLYLDKTAITIKGLRKIMISIKDSLKVRTLSIKSCDLPLNHQEGQEIVELLKQNISLTSFSFEKNYLDDDFIQGIKKELIFNKQIVENIFPQLVL